MLLAGKSKPEVDLANSKCHFNRELSWLEFNYRVLSEALDMQTPLLERLTFFTIFSSNFDKFLIVRVSSIKRTVKSDKYSVGS